MSKSRACHKCGRAWEGRRVEFKALCEGCGGWLHCCLNCTHYDPGCHHECRANATTEYCSDKEKFNVCEEFEFRSGPREGEKKRSRADVEKMFPDLP